LDESGDGSSIYGYDGEIEENGLVYLRARYYAPYLNQFIQPDTIVPDPNIPADWNRYIYARNNPLRYDDPTGLFPTIYNIDIDDKFTNEEKSLIQDTIADYAKILGDEKIQKNLALSGIKQNWTNANGMYNAQYDSISHNIDLQPGWYSPVITRTPAGQTIIILSPPCINELLNFPENALPTDKIGAEFVLAHEMSHALATGNKDTFDSFKDNVDLPFTIFAGFNQNPIIKRNAGRSLADEVFADVIAAYIYSPSLLNQQMKDWTDKEMPKTLK
jgi:RHS repeat-associated protein